MGIHLDGAIACVTGGGRGIGEATARALIGAGARVVIGDVDEPRAHAVADELGPNARALPLDVADPASFSDFVDAARELGPIDLLVNNAGIQRTGDFVSQPLEVHHREIAINLGGVVTGMRLVLPEMQARDRGHVVNVCSMAGKMSVPGAAVYTASKFGVASLSRAVRSELEGSRVTISTVLPSAVRTELAAGLDLRGVPTVSPEDVAEQIVASCRHGRAEVTVPRWLGSVGLVEQAVPERVGELVKRVAGAQERLAGDNEAARRYQDRITRA